MTAIPAETADPATSPGILRRFALRFALLAFAAYHLPLLLNDYPTLGGDGFREEGLAHVWGHVFTWLGLWVARHVFHLTGDMSYAREGDNGDTAEEYCRLLVGVVVAAVAASAWTLADRRAPRARWAGEALRVLLRYSLAIGLASYAVAKLLPQQFRALGPEQLEMRIGELSPMGLLWRFMGASRPYALFGGILEIVVVVLLSFRRTATLGALVCIPVMANVAMMNLCYGVPVKLFSISVLASATVLVLYDAPRLAGVLVLHRAMPPPPITRPFLPRCPEPLRWVLKVALVGGAILSSFLEMRPLVAPRAADSSPLHGNWRVDSFVRDGRELAQTADPTRWRRLTYGSAGVLVRLEDEALARCRAMANDAGDTLTLTCKRGNQGDPQRGELRWSRDGERVRMDGTLDGAPVSLTLTRLDVLLPRARFRWIDDAD
jgi:hypothetical protein